MLQSPHPWQDPESQEFHVDYCIVGGGISGLYTALRLAQGPPDQEPPRICILEATRRVGGRIATIDIPGTSLYADLGAMRFIPTQPLLSSVIEHFGLTTYNYDFPTDFYFVRGQRVPPQPEAPAPGLDHEVAPLSQPLETQGDSPYRGLRNREAAKDPGKLVIHAIAKVLEKLIVVEPDYTTKEAQSKLADVNVVQEKLTDCYQRVMDEAFLAFTPKEWRTIKLYGKYPNSAGLYLFQLGFWDVVQSQLSSEAYSFIDEGLGYQTIIGTWNAADAIPWFLADFSKQPYQSILGGMGEIPKCLHKAFLSSMVRRRDLSPFKEEQVISLRTPVTRISWDATNKNILINATLLPESKEGQKRIFQVRASHCMVCLPKGGLEKIDFRPVGHTGADHQAFKLRSVFNLRSRILSSGIGASDGLAAKLEFLAATGSITDEYSDEDRDDPIKVLLDCVEQLPLLKMFLAYKNAWWEKVWRRADEYRDKGSAGFKVFTNLPLRQIYYHLPDNSSTTTTQREGADDSQRTRGLVMAYCDAKHASYWDALAFQERKKYIKDGLENAMRKGTRRQEGERDLEEFGVSRHLAERAHEQIWRNHRGLLRGEELPPDIRERSAFSLNEDGTQEEIASSETVLFMNWMRPPFYAGWHAWRIGVVSDNVKAIWERPWPEANIYFAGEVISSDQGWSEGALRSAERVLMHQLRLPPPHWTKKVGTREDLKVVDVNQKAKDLGFEGIEEYVSW